MEETNDLQEKIATNEIENLSQFIPSAEISKITEQDVLRPFEEDIAQFNTTQKNQWGRWKNDLPARIANVHNLHKEAKEKQSLWKNLSYVLIVVSAVVPPIVAYLTTIAWLSPVAAVIDVIPPAVVVATQKLLSDWTEKRTATATTRFPYNRLLSDLIGDIKEGKYQTNENAHRQKSDKLDQIVGKYL